MSPKHTSGQPGSGLPPGAEGHQAAAGPSSAPSSQQTPGSSSLAAVLQAARLQAPESHTLRGKGAPTYTGDEYGIRRQLGPGGTIEAAPMGWKPDMTWSPQKIVDQTDDHYGFILEKIATGSIPPTYPATAETLGFKPEVLVKNHVLWDDCVKPNNLKNPIHPIFRQDRFKSVPIEMYRFLQPALRLASRFFTAASCSQFWITVFSGQYEKDLYSSIAHGIAKDRIQQDVPVTSERYWQFRERLNWWANKADAITFHFEAPFETPLKPQKGAQASCFFVHRSEVIKSLQTQDWLNPAQSGHSAWHCPLMIHYDYYVAIAKLLQTTHRDPNQLLRFYLHFAVVMIHELTHAIYFLERRATSGKSEPLMPPEIDRPELGFACEGYLFGMTMEPINSSVDCIYGLSAQKWPREKQGPPGAEDTIDYALPMSWVSWIQQDDSWPDDYMYSPEFVHRLRIDLNRLPRAIGCVSTTLTRAEIIRVGEEEMAEYTNWDLGELRKDGFFGAAGISESTVDVVRKQLQELDPTGEVLQKFRTQGPPTLERVPINSRTFPMLSPQQLEQMFHVEQNRFQQRVLLWQACNLIVSHEREEAKWEVEAADVGRRLDNQSGSVRRWMQNLNLE